jgi:uncharacterized protein
MTKPPASFWKEHLQLVSHVEGGSFNEVYRSDMKFSKDKLPSVYNGERHACTHIYFMLEAGQFSAFHRIAGDELWHFYSGDPLTVYEIDQSGKLIEHHLGPDPYAGHTLFCIVKGGNWFGSRLDEGGTYGLVGCTVSPGFDFAEFEMAKRDSLITKFPQYRELIEKLS